MQGEVTVYTPIIGRNMRSISLLNDSSINGSTNPGVVEDEWGQSVNVSWQYPGGINGKQESGQGFWGYAVVAQSAGGSYSFDSTITSWLKGEITGTNYPQPSHIFTDDEITNNDSRIRAEINELIYRYVSVLLGHTDTHYDDFKQYFVGCYVIGR